ncbi:hypothetical protein ACMFMG_000411 [Clarireedia jacksonii]
MEKIALLGHYSIIGLGITNLMGALENTVISTAAPAILIDLHLSLVYELSYALGSPSLTDIIVSDLVSLRQRGNHMTVVLAIYDVGVSLGLFTGGAVVSLMTWRWVLNINLRKDMNFGEKIRRIDFVGNGILMTATVAILYALGNSRYLSKLAEVSSSTSVILGTLPVCCI